jgi:hypothetical protein
MLYAGSEGEQQSGRMGKVRLKKGSTVERLCGSLEGKSITQ